MEYFLDINKEQEQLKTNLMTMNMGPQHPATHGVLRVEIKTDSEVVAQAIPHLGYLHRCMEKHCEHLDFRGVIPFCDRMDYLAAMNMEWGYCLTVEKLLGTEVPVRAQYIRTIVAEMQRIASHLMFFGTYAIDLGAFTPFLYAFQDREFILRIFEELSGARLLYNYIWLGGVWNDINDDQLQRISNWIEEMEESMKKYHALVGENKIFIERTANVGVIDKEMAFDYGATGPVLRGSGVDWDLRKTRPYGMYEKFDFNTVVGKGEKGRVGDCWDRYYVRVFEIFESLKILRQCLEGIEAGPVIGKVSKIVKPAPAEIFLRTECPRGELGYHLITDGSKKPYRLKVKSSCFTHVSMLPDIGPGQLIADFVASIGSIDIVLGEVDR
ncbi:MAG: NADH-quinone oxidoreductase subunit NuoD [Bdellovibrio sp. CG12_big_fil_rev_8_21_14_0_65_39_13]|nr:MAG: NADH-quinone oxidoreductase subunit NuoD [Bdellovibrio sp. CG22_combo_CG10-13_8_21_14_all_39_27]PIQ59314.1 MAG: NADH-quinone oxidoreductase subunit NuoD [Bdellovibrio sp. CG12_big_fil_rev_8_21_14_0_65_39_13]PIR32325.1 MAG: NADH-quinone oxidoreductase subunit NuoD [Bdellovibrio sp. CG11_big_fil_rev_8_21_14_0_20_39_38]